MQNKAERLFTSALKKQGENIELYRACIKFYIRSDQKEKIPELLDEADSSISDALPEYIVKTPKFSLDDGEDYDDVQQLKLTAASGCKIYYTKNKKNQQQEAASIPDRSRLKKVTQLSMQLR